MNKITYWKIYDNPGSCKLLLSARVAISLRLLRAVSENPQNNSNATGMNWRPTSLQFWAYSSKIWGCLPLYQYPQGRYKCPKLCRTFFLRKKICNQDDIQLSNFSTKKPWELQITLQNSLGLQWTKSIFFTNVNPARKRQGNVFLKQPKKCRKQK